ncbi:MAG TPA: cyclopropane-fatty-acyl-phospholipid synthase family protein [Mycobacteriales bacterium]|nr:cyclopropane-fatty-acyl-phospholipid synthase family protein [Mycobacteriales bacterium]
MGLAQVFGDVAGPDEDVRFTAYDGSATGRADAPPTVEVRTPRAVAYLAQAPGSLGLARAYITGDLEVHGDMYAALARLTGARVTSLGWRTRLRTARRVGSLALRRVAPPPLETRLRGRRHSKARDAAAIAHHYDVSNRFYELLLGPSMAYTCAVWPDPTASLETAQWTKHELVAGKLGLRPGMRLLDVGCGWGGMVMHAAREHGVRALGVTLSRRQADWAQQAIAAAGLSDLAEVRYGDYRDICEPAFDAVSSIGLTEHVGRAGLNAYFTRLHGLLLPGGRLLNHCITRPRPSDPPIVRRGFINRYVFPDGELAAVGPLVTHMQEAGFEVRHLEDLREHYALTCAAWLANLEAHWAEAIAEVGEARARVWRLYVAGSRLGFERDEIELHQVLGVRLAGADARMPLRPDFEPAGVSR